jgi:aryl-alcohol dehydrogenase
MKIKAAVVREKSGPFLIEDVELDEPRDNEVLVRIAGTGLCHTDLGSREQKIPCALPVVLGHEGAGIVEKTGSRVTKVQAGDHVVLTFFYCGECIPCKKGRPVKCEMFFPGNFTGKRPDGTSTISRNGAAINAVYFSQSSFASHALANEQNVVKVPKDVPIEILGPLGCGVQTGAGSVLNSFRPDPGESIAVFGTGSVGMSAVLGAAVCGCTTVIAVDVFDERLKLAMELGATHAINSGNTDPVKEIQKIIKGGVDYILESTGIPEVILQSINACHDGGKCGLVGLSAQDAVLNLEIQMLKRHTIFGITEGDSVPDVFIPRMVELYKAGRFPFDKMISFYPLEKINQAAEDSMNGKILKAVLRP